MTDTTAYDIAKAEAEAEAAKTAAKKAEADLQTALNAADAAKRAEREAAAPEGVARRVAEARKATAEADQAARAAAIVLSPVLQTDKAEAETRKAIAEADQASTTAAQSRIAGMLPDFSKLAPPATTLTGEEPIQGAALGHVALRQAAVHVSEAIRAVVPDDNRPILLTTDGDLATADAAYAEVSAGLDALTLAAKPLLPVTVVTAFPIAAVGAMAQALPGLITALSPKVTVSTSAFVTDSTAAVAAVAGELCKRLTNSDGTAHVEGRLVRIDDFRLVPKGAISKAEAKLRVDRDQLARSRSERLASNATLKVKLADAAVVVAAKKEGLGKTPATATDLDVKQAQADEAKMQAAKEHIDAALTVLDDLIARIDAFLLAIHSVPTGGKRSAYVSAALHEELRGSPVPPPPASATSPTIDQSGPETKTTSEPHPTRSGFAAVVLLKAQSGSMDQTYKDRAFRPDKYEGIGSTLISYVVLDPSTSNVLTAGNRLGSACLTGEIGDIPSVKPVTLDL